jgi:hypothetical protein
MSSYSSRKFHGILLIAAAIVACVATYLLVSSEPQITPGKSEALSIAMQYVTGQKDTFPTELAEKCVELVLIENDSTPFLRHQINGKSAWLVRTGELSAEEVEAVRPRLIGGRMFDIYIDSATGVFLRAVCDRVPLRDDEVGDMPPEYVEKEISRGLWRILGYPEEPPPTSMVEALSVCPHSYLLAKKTEVRLLMIARGDIPAKPLWDIILRGIPPLHVSSPRGPMNLPLNQVNHITQTVDATTGNLISTSTFPQYPLKVKVREVDREEQLRRMVSEQDE